MKNKIFGQKCGLRVSELALGTGNFGSRWGYGTQADDAKKIFDTYLGAGGNFIDTADGYQYGESEELVGRFAKGKRNELVIASKFTTGGSSIQSTGNSRKNIVQAVEASLKRLQTDRIDLYWAHFTDNQTPIEEIVRAFDDLVQSGKIIYAGFSNFPAWRISMATVMADLRGWSPIVGIQTEYSLLERTADRELLPMAEALGLGVAYWSPLAGGTLTGKYRDVSLRGDSRQKAWGGVLVKGTDEDRTAFILDALEKIATEHQVKIADVAMAWLRQKDDLNLSSACTIIGPRTLGQLESYLGSINFSLRQQDIQMLNTLSEVALGSPHEVIASQQKSIFGSGSGIEIKHKVA